MEIEPMIDENPWEMSCRGELASKASFHGVEMRWSVWKLDFTRVGAAFAARDGIAVGAGAGMMEEGTDSLRHFGTQNGVNLEGVFVEDIFVKPECLVEQQLGQTMAPKA